MMPAILLLSIGVLLPHFDILHFDDFVQAEVNGITAIHGTATHIAAGVFFPFEDKVFMICK